jgi:Predicted membrane protein (DUF2339)
VDFLIIVGLLVALVPFVMPIVAWVSARRTRARVASLEAALEAQQTTIDRLSDRVKALQREIGAAQPAAPRPAAAAAPQPPAPTRAPERPAEPAPRKPEPVVQAPAPPVVPKPPAFAQASAGQAETVAPPPSTPVPPPRPVAPVTARAADSGAAAERPRPPQPPPPPPTTPPPAPPAEPPDWRSAIDWESLVGVKLFSAIAGIALVLAAVFFLRYSIDHGWLQPPVRVIIGIVVAVGLLVLCELKAARRYPVTANALDAAAIAILFSTFFAAHALWNLIPALAAFGLLAVVTALAVLLSIRRESLFIAVLGLLGGFATPALLSTGENRPIPLFAYLMLLNIGLAWVAYRNTWPVLTWLTLALTAFYQWGWVLKYLEASSLTLAMGIFLVFPVVSFAGLLLARRGAGRDGSSDATAGFEGTAIAGAALPLLFAAYLAAVPGYGARPGLLFGFLLIIDAGLLAVALARRQELAHAAGAVASLLVPAVWLAVSYAPGARHTALAFTALFAVFFGLAPAIARRFGRAFEGAGVRAIFVAPLVLFLPAALARIEPAFASPMPLFATVIALVLLVAWRAAVEREGRLYFIAAFFAIAAQAAWSVTHLTVESLGTAIGWYALFGAVSLGVPLAARRWSKPLEPVWGGGAVLLASLGLLLFLAAGSVSADALWGLAFLLAVINAGMFIEAGSAGLPAISIVGSVGSFGILGIWWMRSAAVVGLLPSLAVMAGLTLITLAGYAWSHRRSPAPVTSELNEVSFGQGLYIGLGGHLFLLFVAVNREWSMPPWPLFGTLAVLTLAVSVTSLATRQSILHAAGAIAAGVVTTAWAGTVSFEWGPTALGAAAASSAFALAWMALARRAASPGPAAWAATVCLLLSQVAVILASSNKVPPPFAAIAVSHVIYVSALLAIAWAKRWEHLALAAVVLPWIAALGWQYGHPGEWQRLLMLGSALYAVFVAYPIVLGRRASGERHPYVAAVLASAMFFFTARSALTVGGYVNIIGVVPVVAGGVMAWLLRSLLRLEQPGQRDLGRLALVAGAALGFITVAIPLQLKHQWITIGWAIEGAALAWLYGRIPHRGLLWTASALLATVMARLALNPMVFVYEPRGSLRIFNWYLYTYAICAAAMFAAGWWLKRTDEKLPAGLPLPSRWLPTCAVILLFVVLNIEIADFYAVGPSLTLRFGATLSQDLTYTIGWLVFGMLLLGAGIWLGIRAARVAAVVLIALTTFKCFLYDLGSLEGLYRVASFVGLAMSLALVALALQKYVLARPKGVA